MVSADTIRTVIGIIGNGTALVLFLSPVPTFYRIWKKKTVEQYSAVPYLATLLNCMMWVLYGLPAVHPHSMLVITINGTGMAIELTYIALFLAFSVGAARRRVLLILLAEVAFVAAVAALVLNLAHTHDRRSMVVGILCVLFGTGMYAAPLSVMKMVIQTKSVEYMPLFLSLASLVNGICWTAYALIKFDLYITADPVAALPGEDCGVATLSSRRILVLGLRHRGGACSGAEVEISSLLRSMSRLALFFVEAAPVDTAACLFLHQFCGRWWEDLSLFPDGVGWKWWVFSPATAPGLGPGLRATKLQASPSASFLFWSTKLLVSKEA